MGQKPQAIMNAEQALSRLDQADTKLGKVLNAYAMQLAKENGDISVDALIGVAEQGIDYIQSLKTPSKQQRPARRYDDIVAKLKPAEHGADANVIADHPYVNSEHLHIDEMNPDIVEMAKTYYMAVSQGDLNAALDVLNNLQNAHPDIKELDQYNLGASTAYKDAGIAGHTDMMIRLMDHPLIGTKQVTDFLAGAFKTCDADCLEILDKSNIQNELSDGWYIKEQLRHLFDAAIENDKFDIMDGLSERCLAIPGSWTHEHAIEDKKRADYLLALNTDPKVTALDLYDTAMGRGNIEMMQHLETKHHVKATEDDYRLIREFSGHCQGAATKVIKHIFENEENTIPDDVKMDCFQSVIKRAYKGVECDEVVAYIATEVIEQLDRKQAIELYQDHLSDYDSTATNYILEHIAPAKFASEDWQNLIEASLNPEGAGHSRNHSKHVVSLMTYAPEDQVADNQWQAWLTQLAEENSRSGAALLIRAVTGLSKDLMARLDGTSLFSDVTTNNYVSQKDLCLLYDVLQVDKDVLIDALTNEGHQDATEIKETIEVVEKWQKRHGRTPPAMNMRFNMSLYKQKAFDGFCEIFQKEGLSGSAAEQYAYQSMVVFGTVERGLEYMEKWGVAAKQPFHDLVSEMNAPVYDMNPKWDADAWGDAIIKHGPNLTKLIGYARHLPQPEKSSDGKTWSYKNTKTKVAEFAFNRASEHPEMAALCLDTGITEEAFTQALDLYQAHQQKPVSSDQSIPNITVMGDEFDIPGYVFKKLPDGDYRGLFLGKLTDCCQYVGGHADKSVKHGFAEPDSGFYVIEDKKGQVISQSWAWRGQNGELVLDSLETLGATTGHGRSEKKIGRIDKEHWQKIFNKVALHVEKECQDISAIHVGTGGRTPNLKYETSEDAAKINAQADLYMDDSKEQYRVWKRKPSI